MKTKRTAFLLTMLASMTTATPTYAQFEGFGMGGFNMGNFNMEEMMPKVKHTKMEQLESNLPVITITTTSREATNNKAECQNN